MAEKGMPAQGLPPAGPTDDNGNNLGHEVSYGPGDTLVPANPGTPVTTSHAATVVAHPPLDDR